MKKSIQVFFMALVLTTGCKKEDLGVRFDMDYSVNLTLKSGSLFDIPFDVFTPDVTTNSESEFEANDTRKDKVTSAEIKSMNLKITAPQGKTFSFLKHIYLYINADGLDEARFAFKENIDDQDTEVSLNTETVNLAEYLKKDKFSLRIETVTRETLNQDVDITADMVFDVKAKILD